MDIIRGYFIENINENHIITEFESSAVSLIYYDNNSQTISIEFSDTTYIYHILDIEKLEKNLSIIKEGNISIGKLINSLIRDDNLLLYIGRTYINDTKNIDSLKKKIYNTISKKK